MNYASIIKPWKQPSRQSKNNNETTAYTRRGYRLKARNPYFQEFGTSHSWKISSHPFDDAQWEKKLLRICHCLQQVNGNHRCDVLTQMQILFRTLKEAALCVNILIFSLTCYKDLSMKLFHQFLANKHHKVSTTSFFNMQHGHFKHLCE